MEIIPSIDLREGKVVRLRKGNYADQLNYAVDAVQTAQAFQREGAKWLHLVDLDGAREGRPAQTAIISRIIAAGKIATQVGGGVRSTEDVDRLLDAGAARVVVGTAAMENWTWFESLVNSPKYAGKMVLALDARDGVVATRGWTKDSGQSAVEVARQVGNWPLAGILYTDVEKDGMMEGPNIAQTRRIAEATKIPVIASGGVGNIQHVRLLQPLPIWGVIIGRSLYEGKLSLAEAIAAAK